MIYVMADIHGHRRRFDNIMRQINLQPEDTLYILGDVIDRNPDGIRILRQLMKMPNVKMLLGNHELMMLEALYYNRDEEDPRAVFISYRRCSLWYRNGGDITHNYLKHIKKAVREEIFKYLNDLPINLGITVNGQKYLLTHAAPMDMYLDSPMTHKDAREFAVWYRYKNFEEGPQDCTVIFGHTSTHRFQQGNPTRIWYGCRLIGIDCGGAYENKQPNPWGVPQTRLACLRLDDMKEFYSEEELMEGSDPDNEPAI